MNYLQIWTVIVLVYGSYAVNANLINEPKCQKYCLASNGLKKYLICCSFVEKSGECPSNAEATYDHSFDLIHLHCLGDFHCPEGFKCCPEKDYSIFELCKPIIYEKPCITTEEKDIKEKEYSGSGSGHIQSEYDDDDEEHGSGSDKGFLRTETERTPENHKEFDLLSDIRVNEIAKMNSNNELYDLEDDDFMFDYEINDNEDIEVENMLKKEAQSNNANEDVSIDTHK